MTACGEWAWYHPAKGLSRFYCGGGNCERPKCQELFWSRRVRLISALISEHELKRFFTLTLDPECIQGDSWAYIHHPWSKLRKRIARRFPGWKFVAILERHKSRDVPHIHGFTDIYMETRQWSHMWEAVGGGRIVWLERVKDAVRVGEYVGKQLEVAKYVGKQNPVASYRVTEGGETKRVRTLWRSKGLKAKYELTSEEGWCIIQESVYGEEGELTKWGEHVERSIYGEKKPVGEDLERTQCAISP